MLSKLLSHARRPSPAMVVAFIALLVAGGGATYAAIPDSDDKEIHGCYSNRTGDLRVIDAQATPPETCGSRETALTWNQQGPPGADGAEGPPGPGSLLESTSSGFLTSVGSTCTNLSGGSVSITVPGPGQIVIEGRSSPDIAHTAGTRDDVNLRIGTTATDCPLVGQGEFELPPGLPTDQYQETVEAKRVVNAAAGTHTFYLNGIMTSGASVGDNFVTAAMTATFFPD